MADSNLEDGSTGSETSEDVALLSEGEEVTPNEEKSEIPPDETKEEESSEEEESEEEKLAAKALEEAEEEALTEEEQEAENSITRPSWNELKEKYPGIEKNKEVREVYFREKAFSEVFSSVDDAKLANDKALHLDYFDQAFAEGKVEVLINALTDETKEVFAEKILPTLYENDPKLFNRAYRPVLVELVNEIHNFADKKQDDNLKKSVLNICKYIFNDYKLPARNTPSSPEIEGEKRKLQEERANLFNQNKSQFTNSTEKAIQKTLDKIILDGLNVKNEFLQSSILKETKKAVLNTIYQDPAFATRMKSLYAQAARSNFTDEYKARIISTLLGRAKGIALKARADIKASALGKRPAEKPENKPNRVEGRKTETKESSKKGNTSTSGKSDMDIILEGA